MPNLKIRKTDRNKKRAIGVRPRRRRSPDFEVRREIIRPGKIRPVVRVFSGFSGTPLQPMLGRLADPATFKKATHAVKASFDHRNRSGGNAVLVKLGDRAVVPAVLELNF